VRTSGEHRTGLKRLAAITFALVLGLPSPTWGQSPYALSWERDGALGASALALGLGAWLAQDATPPLTVDQINALSSFDINPLDRGATRLYSEDASVASDWILYSLITVPLAMLADRRVRDDWQTYLLMYAETLALNGGAGQLVKAVTGRTRPYAYNPDVPVELKMSPIARESFYSSHTSFAFSSAVFLAATLVDYGADADLAPYAVGLAALGATAVGVLRYASGKHFPTDVLVGALAGSLIGWAIPALHRTRVEPASPRIGVAFSIPL